MLSITRYEEMQVNKWKYIYDRLKFIIINNKYYYIKKKIKTYYKKLNKQNRIESKIYIHYKIKHYNNFIKKIMTYKLKTYN